MVEFGLKLEDNKVDDWADKYIDYEKLKAVLKRGKASIEYRDDLLKRVPPAVVAEVFQERKDRSPASFDVSVADTEKNSDKMKPPRVIYPLETTSRQSSASSLNPVGGATDKSPLLGQTVPMKKMNSWGSLGQKVTSYLGLVGDSVMLNQAYDDVDLKMNMFRKTYEQEVSKVKDFYQEKTDEISQRMEVLVESVDTAGLDLKKPKKHEHRMSIVDTMTNKFENMVQHMRTDSGVGVHDSTATSGSIPDVVLKFSESLEDAGLLDHGDPEQVLELKRKKEEFVRRSDSIKRAITDIYRTSKLLHNYSIMNYTGFVKIAKKFDKTFKEQKGMFKGMNCDDGKQAEILAAKMERIYSKWFCDGDLREAQAQMLPKRGDGLLMDWTQLRLGYRFGMCSILAMWVAWDCVWGQYNRGEVSIGGRLAFPVFRACFGLLAWHWFWGLSVYVWNRYRINYIYLFEFDPRNVDTPIEIMNDAVDETLVYLICMLMYYKADSGDMPLWIPPRVYPFFLILYASKCLIFPWKQRGPMWKAIKEVVLAPFYSPTFFHTYVGDVFTSMIKVFQDIAWTTCFVASGDFLISEEEHEKSSHIHVWTQKFWYKNVAIPLVCLMPLLIRFVQCLRRYFDTGKRVPNLPNAFKYSMSMTVTVFGAFHPLYLLHSHGEVGVSLANDNDDDQIETIVIGGYKSNLFQLFWMGLFVTSSLYSFCWDVYMDWGLGRKEYGWLGPRLMFPKKSEYYTAICADLVLRFMWVLTLIPPQSGAKFELPAYLSAISMTVELFRRTIWSFFRLEHEHRQNTQGFRRVNVVPLHFTTGHKHKYHERTLVGWKVLVEILIVTSVVVAISAISVITAQRATNNVQQSNPMSHLKDL